MQAVLKAQINKTDRNDARGIAQMMRVGLYRPVHVKTLRSPIAAALQADSKVLNPFASPLTNSSTAEQIPGVAAENKKTARRRSFCVCADNRLGVESSGNGTLVAAAPRQDNQST